MAKGMNWGKQNGERPLRLQRYVSAYLRRQDELHKATDHAVEKQKAVQPKDK